MSTEILEYNKIYQDQIKGWRPDDCFLFFIR